MQKNEAVTIVNQWVNPDTMLPEWYPSILDGCSWYTAQEIALDSNGVTSADRYAIRLFPGFVSREGRAYIEPKAYGRLPKADLGQYWTVQNGDRVVRGAVALDIHKASELEEAYGEVAIIVSFADNRNGLLPHIRIGGK